MTIADRKHDLPPLWDGNRVVWRPWAVVETSLRFHVSLDHLACRRCGSLATPASSGGTVMRSRDPEVASLTPCRSLHVSRCTDCGHDTVLDLTTDESWDLDASDYGDEGSFDPTVAQGALF